mmetsp:Transcript_25364/g.59383  ORF Transcript_25364/g.59383 Transcript_25364/m.59383 type:complete len:448 (-) Transcript_25364:1477-2820(-)
MDMIPNASFLLDGNDNSGYDSIPSSSQSSTCESCGWIAAFVAMLAFGTFGVPVKSKVAKELDIDPLVMQSYKTGMCFLTSWLFLLIRGEAVTFTPWGIVSAIFWVPSGVATIFAIKTAGLATAIGVGSSFIVLVSFTWGIFFFEEHVHSKVQACSAVACMLCGLAGMAYYSAPSVAHSAENGRRNTDDTYYQPVRPEDLDFFPPDEAFETSVDYLAMDAETAEADDEAGADGNRAESDDANIAHTSLNEDEALTMTETIEENGFDDTDRVPSVTLCCGRVKIQERILGILAALFVTGLWGGSMMVPMQFAPTDDKGLPYLTSFAIGATIVTLFLWLLRYLYLWNKHNYSFTRAYEALPSFHLRKMWPYGGACGLLWSIGNFFSILSIENLGEGVGFSTTQAAMLVSGLWGIFYFREVEGSNAIAKWYVSASVTVIGILLLSYEHHEA